MLNRENLEEFTKSHQTDLENVLREYCQHLFLSYLYQQPGSEHLLFKGGTALRIVFGSPRFSEDLDFTGTKMRHREIEKIFMDTLVAMERTGIAVDVDEAKKTSGGYLGIATFSMYDRKIEIQIEVSLRNGKSYSGVRTPIENDYVPPYTLVHALKEDIIAGKLAALKDRHKPRDFYDYFFLLSGNYPLAKEKKNLEAVLSLLERSKINFRTELKKFLPASQAMLLRDFKKILKNKIEEFLGR